MLPLQISTQGRQPALQLQTNHAALQAGGVVHTALSVPQVCSLIMQHGRQMSAKSTAQQALETLNGTGSQCQLWYKQAPICSSCDNCSRSSIVTNNSSRYKHVHLPVTATHYVCARPPILSGKDCANMLQTCQQADYHPAAPVTAIFKRASQWQCQPATCRP